MIPQVKEYSVNTKLTQSLFATLLVAAICCAGIGHASAADDIGYHRYLHNLDAANPIAEQGTEQAQATVGSNETFSALNQAEYARYMRNNGWLDENVTANA